MLKLMRNCKKRNRLVEKAITDYWSCVRYKGFLEFSYSIPPASLICPHSSLVIWFFASLPLRCSHPLFLCLYASLPLSDSLPLSFPLLLRSLPPIFPVVISKPCFLPPFRSSLNLSNHLYIGTSFFHPISLISMFSTLVHSAFGKNHVLKHCHKALASALPNGYDQLHSYIIHAHVCTLHFVH